MPFLSLVLLAGVNRWMNIVFGAVYTVTMISRNQGGWHFYVFFGLLEIALAALASWYSWTWQKGSLY
jgi:hypothetical protein